MIGNGAKGGDRVDEVNVRAELIDSLARRLPDALIGLDFDGSLAPLVPDPERSRLVDGAGDAIAALARAGAHIALITGRDAPTAVRLSGLAAVPGLTVLGLYGAERWSAGRLVTLDDPPELEPARRALAEILARTPGTERVWIEDKRLSLVVHARRAADPDAAIAAVYGDVSTLADRLGLQTHPGHDVLELRLPGYDKGVALRELVAEFDPAAVLYVGDDLGDLPAFMAMTALRVPARSAWSIAVGDPPPAEVSAAVDLCVPGPSAVVAVLVEIAAAAR